MTSGLAHLCGCPNRTVMVMKLTAFLLVATCLHVSAIGTAQNVTISGKDIPLQKVFTMIEKQTGYAIFYDLEIFKSAHPVTLDLKNASVEDALKECLKDEPLEYRIVARSIQVIPKPVAVTWPLHIPLWKHWVLEKLGGVLYYKLSEYLENEILFLAVFSVKNSKTRSADLKYKILVIVLLVLEFAVKVLWGAYLIKELLHLVSALTI